MAYDVSFSRKGERSFRKLPRDIQERCIVHLEALAVDPRAPGVKKMVGAPYYRARLGQYRIIYEIRDKKMLVLVVEIDHRSSVYRKN